MILSIVTGTYNRLSYLQAMIASARRNIPVGITHEFVVVDGGSTDGTLDWCKTQADVVLIEQGELLGAIRAFCDGAKAAQGDYVLLANDDIEFVDGSIISAIWYLEQPHNSNVGAVAFADDRPAPGYEGQGFKVQTMQVMSRGDATDWPYAQVGLFRWWLGDLCGWWGADDSKFKGLTYGGDNYLSARIYEFGYEVHALSPCKVTDRIPDDGLREHNYSAEQKNPGAYYKRYPTPPKFASLEKPDNPQTERLRILYLPLYEPGYGKYKRGLREALQRVGLVWEVDYQNERDVDLLDIVTQFQPHLLLMQCHSPDDVPLDTLIDIRKTRPEMVVVNWNGDVYDEPLVGKRMLAYLRHVDMQLVVNADVLDNYAAHGIPAAYWQVAYEPVDKLPDVPHHDVIFLANAYSAPRKALGRTLRTLANVNVGLYGREWEWGNGDTTYNFAASTALCQRAKIVIGDNQYGKRGFVSNRIFETLAAGGFLLHQTVPGLEELTGIQAGVHYVEWTDNDDLVKKINYWLKSTRTSYREGIAKAGQAYVLEHHSFDARVKQLLTEILPAAERVRV